MWSMSERFETKRCIKALYKYSSFPFFFFPIVRYHSIAVGLFMFLSFTCFVATVYTPTITHISWSIFILVAPMKTRMNTPESHAIYLFNSLMTSQL